MKVVALISSNDTLKSKWQFDRVMAAIAYDFDLSVVFICEGCQQIRHNKAWKCLSLYGIEHVYWYNKDDSLCIEPLFEVHAIAKKQLQQLIEKATFVL